MSVKVDQFPTLLKMLSVENIDVFYLFSESSEYLRRNVFFSRWQLDFLETVYFLTNYLFFLVGKIDLQKEFQITKVEYCPRIVYSHDRALSSLVYKWFYYEPNSLAGNIYCLFWLTPCTVWYFLCSEMEDEMNLPKNLDKDS